MQQCVLRIGFFLLLAAVNTKGLKCMTCKGSTFEDCDIRGRVTDCQQFQQVCETSIRRYADHMVVEKRCKDESACQNNQMQNDQPSGNSTQCNKDQTNSFCTCCCDKDVCNGGIPSCYKDNTPQPTVNDCPDQEQKFPHGNMTCFGGADQNKICQYKCTSPNYSLYPKGRDTNVCTSNSTWSTERPCCARQCPPYLLYDSMTLFHYKSESMGREQIISLIRSFSSFQNFAWDGAQEAVMYFSDKPQLGTLINFVDSNYDPDKLTKLAEERMNPVNGGTVNFGAAIRYALNNTFTAKAGARDSRVPKMLSVVTDENPDDPLDAVAAAREARARGIFVYVYAFGANATTFNKEVLINMVGDEKGHLYIFDDHYNNLEDVHFEDVAKHFCSNPCDHVLHDHN